MALKVFKPAPRVTRQESTPYEKLDLGTNLVGKLIFPHRHEGTLHIEKYR